MNLETLNSNKTGFISHMGIVNGTYLIKTNDCSF